MRRVMRKRMLMDHHLGPCLDRRVDIIVSVADRAGNRDENIARQHLARIVDHSPARRIAVETAPGDQKLAQYPFKR